MAILASYTGSDNNWKLPDGARVGLGCSFTAVAGGDTGYITLSLKRVGNPGTLTINIYAVSGDYPTGDVLASGTYDTSSISPSVFEDIEVTLTATTLAPPTKYVYTMSVNSGGVSDYLRVDGKDSFGVVYSGGEAIQNTGSWVYLGSPPTLEAALVFEVGTGLGSPSKASNPTPANGGTEIDFSGHVLDWDGDGDTYDVWGGAAGNWIHLASGIVASTYTLEASEVTLFKQGVVTWRVDSTNDEGTTTGDEWTFDPRPGKASSPTPTDTGTDISIEQDFSWTIGANGTTNDLFLAGSTVLSGSGDTSYSLVDDLFGWEDSVEWRVDSINEFGTTDGDTWGFTAKDLDHLQVTYTLIDGGSGDGPYDGGTEGTDYFYTGLNNVITVQRLVAFGKDRCYFEGI